MIWPCVICFWHNHNDSNTSRLQGQFNSISFTSISFCNIYQFNLRKAEVRSLDRMASWLRDYYCQVLLIKLIMNLSCNDLYNSVLIMLDSLQIFEEDFLNLAIQSSDQHQSLYHIAHHDCYLWTMSYFSDQIKNVSKTFVIKLYKIAKQYSFMSLTRVEESIGLSPITYEQELLGSRDSQGDFRRETQTF